MTITQLNNLLGRELGRVRLTDEPVYKWEWSEDLFWPAYRTGGRVEKRTPAGIVYFEPEYRRDRMSHKLKNQWVVTKWCAPESLENWQQNFPGADYPANGYRIHTDWANPPGVLPSIDDTNDLIRCVREKDSMSFTARLADMEEDMARGERARDREVRDAVRDSFTAALNPYPGKRGNFVSWQTGVGESPHLRKQQEQTTNG